MERPPTTRISWIYRNYERVTIFSIFGFYFAIAAMIFNISAGLILFFISLVLFFYAWKVRDRYQSKVKISKSIYMNLIIIMSLIGSRFANTYYAIIVFSSVIIAFGLFYHLTKIHTCYVCNQKIALNQELITLRPASLLNIEILYFHSECYLKYYESCQAEQRSIDNILL